MDFVEFIKQKNTYSLASIHSVFAYKCILAIMYWLDNKEVEYNTIEDDDIYCVEVKNGVTITTEDIGDYISFKCPNSHPTKIDIRKDNKPVILCSKDDKLDVVYMTRFAPGLHLFVEDYEILKEFKKYVVCDDDIKHFLKDWVELQNEPEQLIDVLFVIGRYNAREIANDVSFGSELVIFEYGVDGSESLRLDKTEITITIEDGRLIVNGVIETV